MFDNNVGDYGFFWIIVVIIDGFIVVVNSYGLVYIFDGMELLNKVYLVSVDYVILVDEIVCCVIYLVLVV